MVILTSRSRTLTLTPSRSSPAARVRPSRPPRASPQGTVPERSQPQTSIVTATPTWWSRTGVGQRFDPDWRPGGHLCDDGEHRRRRRAPRGGGRRLQWRQPLRHRGRERGVGQRFHPGRWRGRELRGALSFPVENDPRAVAVGDFNRDGDPDLAIATASGVFGPPDDLSILLGATGASFSSPTNFAVGSGPESVAVGDFNDDGEPDLAVTNRMVRRRFDPDRSRGRHLLHRRTARAARGASIDRVGRLQPRWRSRPGRRQRGNLLRLCPRLDQRVDPVGRGGREFFGPDQLWRRRRAPIGGGRGPQRRRRPRPGRGERRATSRF